MQSIIALIRHGEYEQPFGVPSAHLPHPLTKAGWVQAAAAASEVAAFAQDAKVEIDPLIDCSSLRRAWDTANGLAQSLGSKDSSYKVVSFDALAERSVGAAANLAVDEIERIVAQDPRLEPLPNGWKADSRLRLPFLGAESLLEAGQRVAEHIRTRLRKRNAGKCRLKLFVGHGAAFRHAAVHLGALNIEQASKLSMFHAKPVFLGEQPNGSWRHVGGQWKQRSENNDDC
jgi:broad specificity phosphatase PhoE